MGKGKKASFNYIKERVWRKLQGWESKLLSQAGQDVLLKAFIQAILTHAMGYFKLTFLIKKFWWGQCGDRRKSHWLKWDEMTKSKMVSGMGIRDLALLNDSLLAKQVWRLLHNRDSLFNRVLKARFFPNGSIIKAKDSKSGSCSWKSILKCRDVIARGACWWIGDGKSMKI